MSNEMKHEATRLLKVNGTIGRHMARKTGIAHQILSDLRRDRRDMTDTWARRILKAFGEFAKEITPQITEP